MKKNSLCKLSILLFLMLVFSFSYSCKKRNSPTENDNELFQTDVDKTVISDDLEDEVYDDFENEESHDNFEESLPDEDFDDNDDDIPPNRLYVKQSATGANNGMSWKNAFTNFQDAIEVAGEGYEIWVAKGVYKPDRVVNKITPVPDPESEDYERFYHFSLKDKVAVLGGFAGNEKSKEERNWVKNETILSGDLDDSGDLSGKDAYNVMLNINLSKETILDGFTVTGGNADYQLHVGTDYYPKQGGGINNRNSANFVIRNCLFKGNYAFVAGGAIANLNSHPQISDSRFEENKSGRGGAISNDDSSPYIKGTVFERNIAENGYGGAVFNKNGSKAFFVDCSFLNNEANDGGAINNAFESTVTVSNSLFSKNKAINGGAISNSQSNPYINGSIFEFNEASVGGGAIENFSDSSPRIVKSVFKQNIATGFGTGGAILTNTGIPLVVSSLFYENKAHSGGGVTNVSSSGYFINCTFSRNEALGEYEAGGAILNQSDSKPIITNSILFFNLANSEKKEICNENSVPVIEHCNIENSFTGGVWDSQLGINKSGNFNVNPLFVSSYDFALSSLSLCIGKGTNAPFKEGGMAGSFQEDLLGNPRISNETVDVGAYEFVE
ncbi:MAG: hypothetical protein ACOX2F_11910 [bacterium]